MNLKNVAAKLVRHMHGGEQMDWDKIELEWRYKKGHNWVALEMMAREISFGGLFKDFQSEIFEVQLNLRNMIEPRSFWVRWFTEWR